MENSLIVPATSMNENEIIRDILNGVESITKFSKLSLELQIDTEQIRHLRKVINNPIQASRDFSDAVCKFYVAAFLNEMIKRGLDKFVAEAGVEFSDFRVSIWLYFKEQNYDFETRSRFYELKAYLSGLSFFHEFKVELMLLREGEISIPTSFKNTFQSDAYRTSSSQTSKAQPSITA